MLTSYTVGLHSEEDERNIAGIAELKENGSSIYCYGPNGQIAAIFDKNDVYKMVPYAQQDE